MSNGGVECVFVYNTDHVALRWLPSVYASGPSFRIPRAVTYGLNFPDDVAHSRITVDDFDQRAKMFNGRPVFVARGFDVLLVYSNRVMTAREWFHGNESQESIMNTMRNDAFRFAYDSYPEAREIDRWEGEGPYIPEADRMHIIGRQVRLLVAVRKR